MFIVALHGCQMDPTWISWCLPHTNKFACRRRGGAFLRTLRLRVDLAVSYTMRCATNATAALQIVTRTPPDGVEHALKAASVPVGRTGSICQTCRRDFGSHGLNWVVKEQGDQLNSLANRGGRDSTIARPWVALDAMANYTPGGMR